MKYESEHLLRKLKVRDPEKYKLLQDRKKFQQHPLFTIVKGKMEDWEIVGGK